MNHAAQAEENSRLDQIQTRLTAALGGLDRRARHHDEEAQAQKTYLWEHRADMDHIEKIASRQSAQQSVLSGEAVAASGERIRKLMRSPYFGRFDFKAEGAADAAPVYVGVHGFYDEKEKNNLIFDWRAPISNLFYDCEPGPAAYQAPSGTMQGEIRLKRQFRIRDGRIEFMLDSGLHIVDDILQKELQRASDERMKNIVATIQRDQNAIIRNEDAQVLVIQGVAGSGKTSIALHRIAFLLYRFKDTLRSSDILIISPNKVFADYISNVLPELGEEQIEETEMDALADELLEGRFRFQTFFEQISQLLDAEDPELQRRIREKSTAVFVRKLDQYATELEKRRFRATDLWIAKRPVPAWFLEETFARYRSLPAAERLKRLAEAVEANMRVHYNLEITVEQRRELKGALKSMYHDTTLRRAYVEFFDWLGMPDLFRPARRGVLEYADVFPLIYLKIRLQGIESVRRKVKHLLIDEMQDYTAVQYAVIEKLFPCRKTILGDASQSVNPFGSSTAERIQQVVPQSLILKLCKSYRSSYEITQFAQAISPNAELEAIERHGEAPAILRFDSRQAELVDLRRRAQALADSGHQTLGILCKTQRQAERLHRTLAGAVPRVYLLTARSTTYSSGIVICTAHLAKGLEFDEVIVPQVDAETYSTSLDRNLLYVACTRAMHLLTLTFTGTISPLVPRPALPACGAG